MQGVSQNYNPYTAYGSGGYPTYRQNPAGTSKQNPAVSSKQNPEVAGKQYYNPNFNQMNPTGYNNYNNNDDLIDQNYYPLQDSWYLSYL